MDNRPQQPPEGRLIAQAQKRARLSGRKAADKARMSEGHWRAIVSGSRSISKGVWVPVNGPAETLARMAQAVGVTPEQLEEAGRPDAAEELRAIVQPDDDRTFEEAAADAERALTRIEKGIEARADDRDRPLAKAAIDALRAILEKSTTDGRDA